MILNKFHSTARWFLAVVLMFAGSGKLVQISAFQQTLEDTGFVTANEAQIVSVTLPLVEIALAILLVLNVLNQIVLPAVLMLALCFTGVHGYAMVYGAIDCGCLGLSLESGGREWIMLGISLAMLTGTLILTFSGKPRRQQVNDVGQPVPVSPTAATD